LPAATQWDLVNTGATAIACAHEELINQAAQSRVVYNDDTTMKVLQLTRAQRAAALADDVKGERTGIFTSGIVATDEGRRIALFFTGVRHAGENLNAVLERRRADLPPPIQMADGLSRNVPSDFDTILGSCLAHARRKHAELVESFPAQVRFVLETLREVYIIDARARKESLDPQQRLLLHQEESQPLMEALEKWLQTQFTERIIEPNSSLGAAILYMQKRWTELTLFLRIPGAPLDSNIVERALKKAILHRKAALFYKTLNGARVGDVFMSLIYTAELNDVPPFEYLIGLLQHSDQVRVNPSDWMPWNYQQTLVRRMTESDPPPQL
jgi:transposase